MLPIPPRGSTARKCEQQEERSRGFVKRLSRGAPQRLQKTAHTGVNGSETHTRILVQAGQDAKELSATVHLTGREGTEWARASRSGGLFAAHPHPPMKKIAI